MRKQSPHNYQIFIATPKDKESEMWTKLKPSKLVIVDTFHLFDIQILKRMIAFAKISEKLLRDQFESLSDDRDFNMRLIFKPSLQVITLNQVFIDSQRTTM